MPCIGRWHRDLPTRRWAGFVAGPSCGRPGRRNLPEGCGLRKPWPVTLGRTAGYVTERSSHGVTAASHVAEEPVPGQDGGGEGPPAPRTGGSRRARQRGGSRSSAWARRLRSSTTSHLRRPTMSSVGAVTARRRRRARSGRPPRDTMGAKWAPGDLAVDRPHPALPDHANPQLGLERHPQLFAPRSHPAARPAPDRRPSPWRWPFISSGLKSSPYATLAARLGSRW
jgi:hypothetical protein